MFVLQPSLGTCESGVCRDAVSFWVRSGTFFELFWDFYVRMVKKWGHISGSVSGLAFRRFLVAGLKVGFFCHQRSFVTACVARRQVMCRSGTCCAGYEESEGRCHIVRPVRQVLPAVRCCGLLAVACKADSARYIFWFLPQVAAGHLQALLGLVLLVHSRAG